MSREINLDKELRYKGYWHLPSSPDKKIAGILTYYPNDKIVLELIGSFEDSIPDLIDNFGKKELIIYGDTSCAKEITLVQCFKSANINFAADFPLVTYTCRYMVIGRHINAWDEKCKYSVCARIPELTYWCHPDALDATYKFEENSKERKLYISFSNQYKNKENIIEEVSIDENTVIRIKKGVDYESSNILLTPFIEQYTYIEIQKLNKTSIRELIDDICTFEQFLSLATLGYTESTDITLYDEDSFQLVGDEKRYKEINLIHPFNKENISVNKKRREYLFYYDAVKDYYPTLLIQWYNAPKELLPIRTHLINSIKKPIQNSVDFLIIIQAIEGFWWRFRDVDYRSKHIESKGKKSSSKNKNTELNTILTELISEFSDVAAIKNSNINITGVVHSRHYYSHFMPEEKKPNKLEGLDLIKEARKLKTLLISCILSFIGMEKSVINRLFTTE